MKRGYRKVALFLCLPKSKKHIRLTQKKDWKQKNEQVKRIICFIESL